MSVRKILAGKGAEVITIAADASLHETARILSRRRVGALVVVDKGDQPIGMISERDIIEAIGSKGADVLRVPVLQFMTRDFITCALDDSVEKLMEAMTDKRIRHLPVMEGGQLAGIISIGDVVKRRIDKTLREAKVLRDYITTG